MGMMKTMRFFRVKAVGSLPAAVVFHVDQTLKNSYFGCLKEKCLKKKNKNQTENICLGDCRRQAGLDIKDHASQFLVVLSISTW